MGAGVGEDDGDGPPGVGGDGPAGVGGDGPDDETVLVPDAATTRFFFRFGRGVFSFSLLSSSVSERMTALDRAIKMVMERSRRSERRGGGVMIESGKRQAQHRNQNKKTNNGAAMRKPKREREKRERTKTKGGEREKIGGNKDKKGLKFSGMTSL